MESKPSTTADETGLVLAASDGSEASGAPAPRSRQNITVALLPLAIIGLLVVSFAAAAWTFLAALPPA